MPNTPCAVKDKTFFITGAGKGLGRFFVESLVAAGARVGCCSRSLEDMTSLQAACAGYSGSLLTDVFDIRDFESARLFAGRVRQAFGRIDVAILNAGITTENATVENSDIEKWSEAVETNLMGSMKTAKAVIPHMKGSHPGHIIVVGSGLGHRALAGTSSYATSKAGLWMLTRILSQELIDDGILVNELIPGPVKTEIDRRIQTRHSSGGFSVEWNKEPKDVFPLLEFMIGFPEKGPTGQTFSLARREL